MARGPRARASSVIACHFLDQSDSAAVKTAANSHSYPRPGRRAAVGGTNRQARPLLRAVDTRHGLAQLKAWFEPLLSDVLVPEGLSARMHLAAVGHHG
jgi:hypothetical protein